MQPKFLGCKYHEQRFSTSLKVPDKSFFRVSGNYPIHDLVGGEVLLISADDLDTSEFFIGSKEGEILHDVQNYFWLEYTLNYPANIGEGTFWFIFLRPPRSPDINWHSHGAVSECFPFSCKGEDVWDEHSGNLLFINLIDLKSPVKPGN